MADQTVEPTPTRIRRHKNQAIADRISSARKMIAAARKDPEIIILLSGYGYHEAELAAGHDLYRAARSAFTASEWALGEQKLAYKTYESADRTARQIFSDFLAISSYLFKDCDARSILGLDERVPEDMDKFVRTARARYQAAGKNPVYHLQLVQYGSLETADASLNDLTAAGAAHEAAREVAARAVYRRDESVARLNEWIRCFRYAARVALRERPDLLRKIEL